MDRIGLISKDHHFADLIASILPKNVRCDFRLFEDTDTPYTPSQRQPDIFIVDFTSPCRSEKEFLLSLKYQNPKAAIVAIVEPESQIPDDLNHCGCIDDVIVGTLKVENLSRIRKVLLERLSIYRQLHALQARLQREMRQTQIVARSKAMREILQRLPSLSESQSTVLITGETGTGKELIARAIHYLGPRCGQPFVTVDCGALPENLVENELFGHVRGAYTDAGAASKGLIAEAHGGTLFLDEIEALPLSAQAKFLRFLQERQYKPLGQPRYVAADVRVLAATNVDLAEAVAEHRFRKDLYFRLNVVPLHIPPLRRRKSDIPALARYFLQIHGPRQRSPIEIPNALLQQWLTYDWPGNVRELENRVQEWLAVGLQRTPPVTAERVDFPLPTIAEVRQAALHQAECAYLHQLLQRTSGNLSAAARLAKIDRKNLRNLLKKYSIDAKRYRQKFAWT